MARSSISIRKQECIAGMKKFGDGEVDLVFADPPFNIGYDYDVYHDKLESDQYLSWSRDWISEVTRILKPNGTFWLAIGDDYAAEMKVLMQRELGLSCRSWVIWYYTFGVNCKAKFSRSHTHLFHMVKNPKKYVFNADAIRVPSARQLVYADRRANSKGRLPDDTWILRPQDAPDSFGSEEDVWHFPRVAGTFKERAGFHGCQMPEQLIGRILRVSSNEGDLVVDPFLGSGTTAAVAKKLDRKFVGFEISEDYVAQARKRLASIRPGHALDGAPEPSVSAPSTANGKRLDKKVKADKSKRAAKPTTIQKEFAATNGEEAAPAAKKTKAVKKAAAKKKVAKKRPVKKTEPKKVAAKKKAAVKKATAKKKTTKRAVTKKAPATKVKLAAVVDDTSDTETYLL